MSSGRIGVSKCAYTGGVYKLYHSFVAEGCIHTLHVDKLRGVPRGYGAAAGAAAAEHHRRYTQFTFALGPVSTALGGFRRSVRRVDRCAASPIAALSIFGDSVGRCTAETTSLLSVVLLR